ncbi:MAG: hypothetical protein MJZ34_13845 [Paludibacteraceae bacterium]|nr:hypothetical protein [Paludibacteraceae bacterium]
MSDGLTKYKVRPLSSKFKKADIVTYFDGTECLRNDYVNLLQYDNYTQEVSLYTSAWDRTVTNVKCIREFLNQKNLPAGSKDDIRRRYLKTQCHVYEQGTYKEFAETIPRIITEIDVPGFSQMVFDFLTVRPKRKKNKVEKRTFIENLIQRGADSIYPDYKYRLGPFSFTFYNDKLSCVEYMYSTNSHFNDVDMKEFFNRLDVFLANETALHDIWSENVQKLSAKYDLVYLYIEQQYPDFRVRQNFYRQIVIYKNDGHSGKAFSFNDDLAYIDSELKLME